MTLFLQLKINLKKDESTMGGRHARCDNKVYRR